MRMNFHRTSILLGGALFAASSLFAGDVEFDARGQMLLSDDLNGSAMARAWVGKPGKWEMLGDAVKVSQVKEDNHAAVRRHPLQYHDGIFEFSFELDGATMIGLSLNNKGGHVCRLIVNARGIALQVDKPNANSELAAVKLASSPAPIESGVWHKVVVEVKGPRMIAQLDNGTIISGENPRVDVDKIDFGIPVGGVSAKIKGVKVYAVK